MILNDYLSNNIIIYIRNYLNKVKINYIEKKQNVYYHFSKLSLKSISFWEGWGGEFIKFLS